MKLEAMKAMFFALAIFTLFVAPTFAQSPTDDEVNAIAKHLNCPTCDTRSLDACNTQTCIQWKDQIKDMMIAGQTEQEIIDWYVARYGDYVLQEPPRRGLGLLAWLLPIFLFAAAAVWVVILMRRWSAQKPVLATPQEPSVMVENETDEYLRQVEQDLKER